MMGSEIMRHIAVLTPIIAAIGVITPLSAGGLGPIDARITRVVDGDTLIVDAAPWIDLTIRIKVRVDGVDTPEIVGQCQAEKDLAIRARDFVRAAVGSVVHLTNIRYGKYAGRVVAVVWVGEQKLADMIIAAGLGRIYKGGKRACWCGLLAKER